MSVNHTVWSLDSKRPLRPAALKDEKELELLIRDNIDILNSGWLVIDNQVKTDAGKFIDILCIDHDGDMVVVELKKFMTPREVTAQVIDYAASVSKFTADHIAELYLSYSGGQTLNDAFREKFGKELDENDVNKSVKMVIVASRMDAGTERIIRYLRDVYSVDINILFFKVFSKDGERLLSRSWFEEDLEEVRPAAVSKRGQWNGEYYVSFGGDSREWDDAMRYGFISAGGGRFYSRSLAMLSPGDRVWVNIPHTGYVGVGVVTAEVMPAVERVLTVGGAQVKMTELELKGSYFYSPDDPETAEYVVPVEWIKAFPASKAVHELGFFGNQHSVCCPTIEKWSFTVDRLKKLWGIEE